MCFGGAIITFNVVLKIKLGLLTLDFINVHIVSAQNSMHFLCPLIFISDIIYFWSYFNRLTI